MLAKTSLEQWAVLAAVVEQGGFAQAATHLHRSQSAVSYAVSRLQAAIGMPLLEIQGRKAALTPHGRTLLARARGLLSDWGTLESMARSLARGWEPELKLVVDVAYPRARLLAIVAELQRSCPNTQIQLSDVVLSGAEEAVSQGLGDLVITSRVPPGFLGDHLLDVDFIAVASPGHALFGVDHELTAADLLTHVQAVVRDSGTVQPRDDGWLGAERRFTVSSLEASLATVLAGLTYAWLPEHLILDPLQGGRLRRLPLAQGGSRTVALYLVLAHPTLSGPAARAALEAFQRHAPTVPLAGNRVPDLSSRNDARERPRRSPG